MHISLLIKVDIFMFNVYLWTRCIFIHESHIISFIFITSYINLFFNF